MMIERTGKYIGTGVASVINLLNIELVLLGGGVMDAGALILNPIIQEAKRRAFQPCFEATDIVAALALAPLSMVQAVIAGGLAMLALPARLWFGISMGTRELVGLGLSAAGLAFLALTASQGSGDHSSYSTGAMLAFEGGAVAIGGALLFSAGSERGARHGGLLLGQEVTAVGDRLAVDVVGVLAPDLQHR